MKIAMFYVTKTNKNVVTEQDVQRVLMQLGKVGASALILGELQPILTSLIGTEIVAHASTVVTPVVATGVSEGADKVLVIAYDIINALQKVSEPVAYGFCVKGILEKMSGQDNIGNKHMKEAFKGYVMIQVLPLIFDLINTFRL